LTSAMGGDLTFVKCNGEWLPLSLAVDDTAGLVLTVDRLSPEDAETAKEWLEPVAEAVHVELLVSDDADAFKTMANDLGLEHQVYKGHVRRNTEAFIDSMEPKVETDEDGSLPGHWGHARAGIERSQSVGRADPQSPAGTGERA
jgi:hypothetical protein